MEIVTADLSRFGYRELQMAAELLHALKTSNDATRLLGDDVSLCMNTASGYVFLSDEDYNVAMMNGHVLEDWHTCSECGWEGFAEELDDEHHMGEYGNVEHGAAPDEDDEEEEDETDDAPGWYYTTDFGAEFGPFTAEERAEVSATHGAAARTITWREVPA
jgi:hypothetical protein